MKKKIILIEKEYEALPKMIENLIKENFLKKEFYENLPDWSNPEIDNVCNHSALDIENRVKEGNLKVKSTLNLAFSMEALEEPCLH